MCGIAGIVDNSLSAEVLESKARQMMQRLVHRGPDEGGIWRSESSNVVLAHRRLSIQDLSACGAQPMLSTSKRYCIAFNGEIYNFREIAAELRKCGHRFRGHSDTEVMLSAIEHWGLQDAVQRFVGMFAFSLWDREEKILHLCRDRLGEKPLYYGFLAHAFYFASELKAIEAVVPKEKLEIDLDGLSGYLKRGYISAPHSIYRHIHKLMPGTICSLSLGGDDVMQPQPPRPYWTVLESVNQGASAPIDDESKAIDLLDGALHCSVRRQMIADVKIGAFLSGGIDSSVVAAIAQQECREPVRTYTIGFSEKDYDESVYAEKIALHLGSDHLTMQVTPADALAVVPDLAAIYDEPFADSSQIPAYLVSKLAREHVTVCLSGDGGDELFAGYNRYLWTQSLWRRLSILPAPVRRLLGRVLAQPSPAFWDGLYSGLNRFRRVSVEKQKLVGLKIQKLAGFMQQGDIFGAYDYLMSYWNDPAVLMLRQVTGELTPELPVATGFIDQAMYLDQVDYLPGDNLAKVDRASMAVSLETRLPLLSHEVVDLAWRLPVSMKVKNGTSKWALRQVLYRYVPPALIDRPKMGFSVPVARWLRHDLNEWAEDLLAGMGASDGLLQKQAVHKAWQEHMSGQCDHSHRLWTVLMFLSWQDLRRR